MPKPNPVAGARMSGTIASFINRNIKATIKEKPIITDRAPTVLP